MMKCKNCKHWKRNDGGLFGMCNSNKFIDTSKEWDYIGVNKNVNNRSDCLEYHDSEEYKATFDTGEEFGCIHFKEKGVEHE